MSELTNCPICGFHKFKEQKDIRRDVYFIRCDRCGEFEISEEFVIYHDVRDGINPIRHLLSALARELYETENTRPTFLTTNVNEYLRHYLIPGKNSIEEKIQKLLKRVREKTTYFGEEISFGDIETVVPLAYAKNREELIALFTLMTEKKLAKIDVITNGTVKIVKISLYANGWDIANSLEPKNEESKRGFVAIWFDDSMNESINAIELAITESGFRSICIRDEHFSEKIMDKALGEIKKSRFVVVDLTGSRGSVFFEAGFAHGLGIETIYVYREQDGEESPLDFYVKHYKCYKYRNQDDLKETLKNAISARIK